MSFIIRVINLGIMLIFNSQLLFEIKLFKHITKTNVQLLVKCATF